MNESKLLAALADVRKRQILLTAFNEETKDLYPKSYLYALSNGVYPIFHGPEKDAFADSYGISREKVSELLRYLDDAWLDKKHFTFYEIELNIVPNLPNWGKHPQRWRFEIISILRYIFLNGGFNQEFWDALLAGSAHPSEAKGITRDFSNDMDIHLM